MVGHSPITVNLAVEVALKRQRGFVLFEESDVAMADDKVVHHSIQKWISWGPALGVRFSLNFSRFLLVFMASDRIALAM